MKFIKLLAFVEITILFATAFYHLVYYLKNIHFPLSIYPIMLGIGLFVTLFIYYVLVPIADWLFD